MRNPAPLIATLLLGALILFLVVRPQKPDPKPIPEPPGHRPNSHRPLPARRGTGLVTPSRFTSTPSHVPISKNFSPKFSPPTTPGNNTSPSTKTTLKSSPPAILPSHPSSWTSPLRKKTFPHPATGKPPNPCRSHHRRPLSRIFTSPSIPAISAESGRRSRSVGFRSATTSRSPRAT